MKIRTLLPCALTCVLLQTLPAVTDGQRGAEAAEDCGSIAAGDRIYALNGRKIADAAEYERHRQKLQAGDIISVAVDRGKYSFTVEAECSVLRP